MNYMYFIVNLVSLYLGIESPDEIVEIPPGVTNVIAQKKVADWGNLGKLLIKYHTQAEWVRGAIGGW